MGGKWLGVNKPTLKLEDTRQTTSRKISSKMIDFMISGSKGQDLVEFAVMLPFLLIVLVGVVDLGRVFHASITIANASRTGARYANSFGFEENGGITLNSVDISSKAQTEAQNSGITLTSISASCPGGCTRGGPVVVTVTHDFQFLFNAFIGSGLTLSHSTEMKIPW